MARITGSVLGNLSGKLGNLSARTVDGQTILAARPSSFEVSQSPASIEARAKFAVNGTFSKYVLNIAALESIWAKSKLPGMSVYNTLFKKNYPFSNSDKPNADNIITPGGSLRAIYSLVGSEGKKQYISVDHKHGMFEYYNDKGIHQGEFRFDGTLNKKAKKTHDLKSIR